MQIRSFLTSVFLLLTICVSCAQSFTTDSGDSLNMRDSNNFKQGWWKVYNTGGKYKSYNEGQLVEEGEYLNNKKSGVWTKYYPNGNKKHELTFANNVANGYAKIYYRNGKLQEEGIWKNNSWQGQYKFYYEDGTLKYDWSYNSTGNREGEQRYFHENGLLQILGNWKEGKEIGMLTEYHEDGSVKTKRFFQDGSVIPDSTVSLPMGKEFDDNSKKYSGTPSAKQLSFGTLIEGYNKMMNADGTVSKEGVFKQQKLIDGKVYVYEDGKLIKTIIYKGGKSVSVEPIQ
ncbi:toxin-antitoxin system YwqK family antitoxin [Bacteroidota bacterium]